MVSNLTSVHCATVYITGLGIGLWQARVSRVKLRLTPKSRMVSTLLAVAINWAFEFVHLPKNPHLVHYLSVTLKNICLYVVIVYYVPILSRLFTDYCLDLDIHWLK